MQAWPNVVKPLKVMKQQSLTMSFLFFFLSFFPCHSTSLPSIRFHFLAFPFIPFHVLPFTLVSLVGHAPPRHQHCTSYSRKEKRIRFILKFGSVFVSAVRFCDVTFETYFISFDFPLQARPNVAKPLKVMKHQSLTMTFSFFFLFFLFFP